MSGAAVQGPGGIERVRQVRIRDIPYSLRLQAYLSVAPEPEIVRNTTNSFRSMLLIGPMQRGKTSWARAFLGEVVRFLVLERGVDEREIAFVYSQAVSTEEIVKAMGRELDMGRLLYVFLFSDDAAAAAGQHGRRAMSVENVQASMFYIMIRHRLRRMYGYERHLTAIHATQVYTILDKTFREASEIDVIKALPKSERDRRQILELIAPQYRDDALRFLAAINITRLRARSLEEFLRAIYTALVVMEGEPMAYRAYDRPETIQRDVEERLRWLSRVQTLEVQPGEGEEGGDGAGASGKPATINGLTEEQVNVAIHVLKRMASRAMLIKRGSNVEIRFPEGARLHLARKYVEVLAGMGINFVRPETIRAARRLGEEEAEEAGEGDAE